MRNRCFLFPLALTTALLLSGPAVANDSTGFQGTGGIELSASEDIQMMSEDLRIGLDEIRVSYVFRNVGDRPIDTLVVFPLPDLDLSQGLTAPNWGFPAEGPDFLGFRLWVDDRPLAPQLERRAFHQGQDVTREIEAAGALNLVPWKPGGYDEQVKAIPAAALERLRRAGLIQSGEDENTPQWVLRTRYYWRQTFPPGMDVRVRHAYRPFVGNALIGKATDIDGRTAVGRLVGDETGKGTDRYCLDDGTKRALAAVERRNPNDMMPFSAAEIEYIVTTARNWRGPIGRFRLTLDKGAPENILSLCWNGLKKVGPTTFESVIDDFVPDHDIRLLIFVRTKNQP
ncbi:DUF4424 family protein [Azospirillum soli]|uniref:DUF4424 family protein n=1 Tax=Azospirillum soli TaxID=1304799 RepID=UPI001AE79FD4|nr:DUF4424 family protein [Azospirillum soli]MBP2312577.1 hypothetical protein [Azospirillum soli]